MDTKNKQHPVIEQVEALHYHADKQTDHLELGQKIDQLMQDLESGDLLASSKIEVAILTDARNRVKALLKHDHLQQKDHAENKSALEKIRHMLHPMQVIGKMYDYEAEPIEGEKVDLGIDWQGNVKMDRFEQFHQLDQLDASARSEDRGRIIVSDIPFLEVNYSTKTGEKPLQLEGRRRIIKNKETGETRGPVIFELTNPNIEEPPAPDNIDSLYEKLDNETITPEEREIIDKYNDELNQYYQKYGVSNFAMKRVEHDDYVEWDMNDRITSSIYRGQGIAAKLLNVIEQTLAKDKSKTQILKANVGQTDVLIWLINAGYEPETPEDKANLELLMSGDKNLAIVSSDYDEKRTEKRQNYIFKKEVLYDVEGKQKADIWEDDNYGKPIHYMKSSFRINLRKKLN